MNLKASASSGRTLAVVLFVAVSLTGCRTYGDYGTEQATFDQIQKTSEQFAGDLEKARGDFATLQRAAVQNRELEPFVGRYEALLARHEALVEYHDELAAGLAVKAGPIGRLTSSYRNLNRALGTVVADQLAMRSHYAEFAKDLASGDGMEQAAHGPMSRYQAAPPYYERIRVGLEKHSISDALASRN